MQAATGSCGPIGSRLSATLRGPLLSPASTRAQGAAHSHWVPSRALPHGHRRPLWQSPGQNKFAFRIMAPTTASASGTRERLSFSLLSPPVKNNSSVHSFDKNLHNRGREVTGLLPASASHGRVGSGWAVAVSGWAVGGQRR